LLASQALGARVAHAQSDEAETAAGGAAEVEDADAEFEGVAEVEAPPREPTKHTLEQEQLTIIPGTRGDALKAVEILPGVARTPFATNPGPPLLRGSPSNESLVLLDGARVPRLNHFGGLTSFFNSHLLESVTLYPGNYSARFGRAASGVVEAKVRDPSSEGLHALLELSAIDSFALAEGPVAARTSVALAARRSNIDPFIDALVTDDSATVIAAPVYWDYQAIVTHRFDDDHKLRLLVYGSADAFEVHASEAANDDPALQGEFGSRESFHHLQLELKNRLSDVVQQELMVAVGPAPGHGRFGNVSYDYRYWDLSARAEWSIFAAPWLRIDTGVDVQAEDAVFRFEGPRIPPAEGVPSQGSLASEEQVLVDRRFQVIRPAAYAEASIEPVHGLVVVPGVRVDYFSEIRAWAVDPRLTSRLAIAPATTLKAGAGYYSQPPEYPESMAEMGNPKLDPYRTLQVSGGVEQTLFESVRADVEGFYKNWEDRVVRTRGGAPPRYVNGGTGDAYGLEMLLDVRVTPKTQAFLAYTLSRSTRKDGENQPTRLFDDDQTHNLSLTANYDLGSGWLMGARFRYVSGNPYSAVEGAVYDASTDTYRPLNGGINEARNPAFHQLDVRLEKLWEAGPVDLTTYVEVMNVYNAENQEAVRYSFDYQESSSVVGMPFFPNLGIRGEL
jgi:hypothetical protein